MATTQEIIAELQEVSSRISETTRTYSLGVLALVWLFLAGGSEKPVLSSDPDTTLLMVSGLCVMASLFTDYLQYLLGYFNARSVLKEAEDSEKGQAKYEEQGVLYVAQGIAFGLKQAFAVSSIAILLWAVAPAF